MDAYCPPPARHSARTAGQPAKSWPPSCSRPTPKQPQADGALQLHPLEILPGCHMRHNGQRINRISAQPRGARQLGKHWTECHPRHAKATRPGLEASVPGGHTITEYTSERERERGIQGSGLEREHSSAVKSRPLTRNCGGSVPQGEALTLPERRLHPDLEVGIRGAGFAVAHDWVVDRAGGGEDNGWLRGKERQGSAWVRLHLHLARNLSSSGSLQSYTKPVPLYHTPLGTHRIAKARA